MAITQWNDAEDEALQGLPLDAQVLYLRGLRKMMDFSTGEVGRKSRISWRGLSDSLYVEPHHGCSDTGSVGIERLRRAAKWLERSGLVVMRSIGVKKQLIFFLPLADRGKSVQNEPDANPTDKPDRQEAASDMGFNGVPDSIQTDEPDRYLISDKTIGNGYISGTSSARVRDVDEISSVPDTHSPVFPISEKASSGKAPIGNHSPHVRIAVALRSRGVDILPMNPFLSDWISRLQVTDSEYVQAVQLSRRHIPEGTPIPAKYLDRVINSMRNPAQQRQSKLDLRRATYEGLTGKKGGSNVIDITAYSSQGG